MMRAAPFAPAPAAISLPVLPYNRLKQLTWNLAYGEHFNIPSGIPFTFLLIPGASGNRQRLMRNILSFLHAMRFAFNKSITCCMLLKAYTTVISCGSKR
jgi:hypothetical protein